MSIEIVRRIVEFNDFIFAGFDNFISSLPVAEWISDALIDSFHTLPFLFLTFMFIELIEYKWANKINHVMQKSEKTGPLIGSLSAVVPQCGFSIIASTLYTNKFITKGTLIAIYLATSDEALPVLISYPQKASLIMPVIFIKLIIAISFGYLIDLFLKKNINLENSNTIDNEEGCCKHDIITTNKINLWLHPALHTFNVFFFILIITLILNYFLTDTYLTNLLENNSYKFIEPIFTSILGLIPNCAVSIAMTLMLIKGTISFGSAIAGLCSNAGLGLLVLLRKNDSIKDSLLIIFILLLISMISGIVIQNIII